ncbi:U32 family peptidase [Acholeplasma vituli]|uniref:U32 family peptidase n=1 Tax=Paracholeplasma vituli TaxID=69473 RepID=A0ABT2Q0E6_9MOLU|nr:U32 family peptidase [Paracholeplasma vituli]MCU0105383.1 U32 family peptidase [Paracholeplasma vituli]
MKKLVTLFDIDSITKLSQYADGFILGHEGVATRLTRSFTETEIITASKHAQKLNKLIYITMNRILHDQDAKRYEDFIKTVDSDAITGYIVGDIGVLSIAKKLGLSHKIVYNPETLIANVFDAHFYHTLGIQGVYLAKEITLDDILLIGKDRPYSLFAYGHGFLNMFYSKRQLIEAYFENKHQENLVHNARNLTVVEEKRPQYRYPILEDEGGTHVFRNNVYASINHIDELKQAIDFLVIDTIFHDDNYALRVLSLYENPNPEEARSISLAYNEVWDEGFLFKKTVYKPKKVEL